jgi:hypothetical protein
MERIKKENDLKIDKLNHVIFLNEMDNYTKN